MKPLALNLSKMKKVGGDEKSSTFLHPNGHKMVIAHGGVSALQRKQLEKMPVQNFYEGGEAIPYDKLIPAEAAQSAPYMSEADQAQAPAPVLPPGVQLASNGPVTPDQVAALPARPPGIPASAEQVQAAPAPVGTDVLGAYGQGQQAINEQQAVDTQKAANNYAIQKKDLVDRELFNKTAQDNLQGLMAHRQQALNDYAEGHINPNHYVESLSSDQRTAAGIGLFLGGFGSAFTHQGNPALDLLNKQIDRDIAAQESRKDQQKTILGANEALFKDKILEDNQTRVNMNDIYDHKIQLAASQLGTPQAKAAADAAHSKFALENAGLLQSSAMRSAALNAVQGGQGQPEMLIPYLVPGDHQKEALKEASQARSASENHKFLLDQFDKAAKENTAMRTGVGLRVPPSILAMNANELPMIHDLEGRVNEFEQHTLQGLHPTPGDTDSKIAAKRIAYEKFITNKTQTPTLDAFAPGLSSRFKPTAQPVVKTMNGVRYAQVPGGWKRVE